VDIDNRSGEPSGFPRFSDIHRMTDRRLSETSATPYVPRSKSLPVLRQAAKSCHGCDLYKHATQTVFGRGDRGASILAVGEQPGNSEDLQGEPFVGPAGMLLRTAFEQAGIRLNDVYLTNAVKHFKYIQRGKRRIHQKPKVIEIHACRPWLESELAAVQPKVILCLGKTAAEAVLERSVKVLAERGTFRSLQTGLPVMITVHPSSLLRIPDPAAKEQAHDQFIKDLKILARKLAF
jgi:DNA polymerase